MQLTRRTLTRIAVLSLLAIVVGAVGVLLWAHVVLQGMKHHWGAVDYNEELRSESAVLERIVGKLGPEMVPPSARNPKMYRAQGKDGAYYMSFTIDASDVPSLVTTLALWGFRPVAHALLDLPHEPPPAVAPWWPAQSMALAVYRTGEGTGGTWYIVASETGQVWVYTSRGTYPWPEEKRPE